MRSRPAERVQSEVQLGVPPISSTTGRGRSGSVRNPGGSQTLAVRAWKPEVVPGMARSTSRPSWAAGRRRRRIGRPRLRSGRPGEAQRGGRVEQGVGVVLAEQGVERGPVLVVLVHHQHRDHEPEGQAGDGERPASEPGGHGRPPPRGRARRRGRGRRRRTSVGCRGGRARWRGAPGPRRRWPRAPTSRCARRGDRSPAAGDDDDGPEQRSTKAAAATATTGHDTSEIVTVTSCPVRGTEGRPASPGADVGAEPETRLVLEDWPHGGSGHRGGSGTTVGLTACGRLLARRVTGGVGRRDAERTRSSSSGLPGRREVDPNGDRGRHAARPSHRRADPDRADRDRLDGLGHALVGAAAPALQPDPWRSRDGWSTSLSPAPASKGPTTRTWCPDRRRRWPSKAVCRSCGSGARSPPGTPGVAFYGVELEELDPALREAFYSALGQGRPGENAWRRAW